MNKDNAKDYLPLVQALADGKVIQIFDSGKWHDIDNPSFIGPSVCHRIKPEPKEIWVNIYDATGHVGYAYDSEEAAIRESAFGIETARFREVIE
jgi:hypothetical protein